MSIAYDVGERVLCYHGPMIYEAKILQRKTFEKPEDCESGEVGPHCFVHYKGWKKNWDEWVPHKRLLKYTEDNLALQKATATKLKPATSKSKGDSSASSRRRSDAPTRGTKRAREEDDGSKKPELKLQVPDVLKVILVDDWESVTKNSQVVPLPRTPSVEAILEEFKLHVMQLSKPPPHPQVLPNIISGFQTYFDKSLGQNLLYRFERPQYAEIRRKYITGQDVKPGPEVEMSTIYGAEHFLRMLVSLPTMVAETTMDAQSVEILASYVHEMFNFLVKNKDEYFINQYEDTTPQYQNIARS